ncbi:MAG: hypothetical protein J7497_17420, partial [Chitinophagaceae bacterium]|nr:hypothetical protein [Chitinophagaceae bacterium]
MRLRLLALLMLLAPVFLHAQDSLTLYDKAYNLPDKLFGSIHNKSEKFQHQVMKATAKYMRKLERQELKMKKELMKTDSAAAEEIFGDVKGKYDKLRSSANKPGEQLPQVYSGRIDSMKTTLGFLNNNNKVLSQSTAIQSKVQGILKDYGKVQSGLNQTDFIEKQLRERQEYLTAKLQSLPIGKTFTEFKKSVYYYKEQVNEYKKIFDDPTKLEATLLGAVSKIPAFTKFFARYSELGQLFRLPGRDDENAMSINGMQTRQMVMDQIGSQMGSTASAQQMVNSSIANAQSSLQGLKNKLNGLQSNGDPSMPNFKPNDQKTKSFF